MIRSGFTIALAGALAGWRLDNGPLLIAAFFAFLLTCWAMDRRYWAKRLTDECVSTTRRTA